MPFTINVSQRSRRTIYASNSGCALNSNRNTGGGTDDTAALQAQLNYLNTIGGGTLYIEGDALFSQLVVGSNTTVDMMNNGSLYSKGGAIAGPLIVNRDVVAGSTGSPTDANIVIANGYINGNRAGGHGNADNRLDSNGKYLATIGMFGVDKPVIDNIEIYDSPCYNTWLSNVQHFVVQNLKLYTPDPTGAYNQDGIHLSGYCSYGAIRYIKGTTSDDFLAWCAEDGFTTSGQPDFGWQQPGVVAGPIQHISAEGIYPENCGAGSVLRFLSGSALVDDINVRGVYGSIQGRLAFFASTLSFGGAAAGNIGQVSISDVSVEINDSDAGAPWGYVEVQANLDVLGLSNFQRFNDVRSVGSGTLSTVHVASASGSSSPGYSVNQLSIDGAHLTDAAGLDLGEHIQIDGVVKKLVANGINWDQAGNGLGSLIDGSGQVAHLALSGYTGPARVIGATLVPFKLTGDACTVPARIASGPINAAETSVISLTGIGFSTVSAVTINGNAATFSVNNDWTMTVTIPTTTSGLMVIVNSYGAASRPITIGGFADSFNRSNRSLNGDGAWEVTGGTNTFNILSTYLDCGYPSEAYCTIFNTSQSLANGWMCLNLILSAATAGMQPAFRVSGTGAWNGYVIDLTYTTAEPQPVVAMSCYRVTGGATFTQVQSTVNFPVSVWPIGEIGNCAVSFNGAVFTVYINGTQVAQFTDSSPYETAGYCGLRVGGSGVEASGSRICTAFACGA